jgi:hypothetical protein
MLRPDNTPNEEVVQIHTDLLKKLNVIGRFWGNAQS